MAPRKEKKKKQHTKASLPWSGAIVCGDKLRAPSGTVLAQATEVDFSGLSCEEVFQLIETLSELPSNTSLLSAKLNIASIVGAFAQTCGYQYKEVSSIFTPRHNASARLVEEMLLAITGMSSKLHIGDEAFFYSPLETLVLPALLRNIGDGTFHNSILPSLELPASLECIGGFAFYNSMLLSLELPGSLECIGGFAFYKSKLPHIGGRSAFHSSGRP